MRSSANQTDYQLLQDTANCSRSDWRIKPPGVADVRNIQVLEEEFTSIYLSIIPRAHEYERNNCFSKI